MILYIISTLFFGFVSNCRENVWQTFNKFKYDVTYQTNSIQQHLNHLAQNGQKELALALVDSVQNKLNKQYLIKHSLTTAFYVPLTFVYPCISYCKDGLIAISQDQACSSFLDEDCPQLFHIENELYWRLLRGQHTLLRVSLILGTAAFNVYNYSKRLSKINTFYNASEDILASMRHEVENKTIKLPPLKLNPRYTPLLIDALDIHYYNFDQLWNDKVKNMMIDAKSDPVSTFQSMNIIRNNLEQDRYNNRLKCFAACCTLFLFSYTNAIQSYMNDDDSFVFNNHVKQANIFNLFAMLPFSPFLFRILSKPVTDSVNSKLQLLSDFESEL